MKFIKGENELREVMKLREIKIKEKMDIDKEGFTIIETTLTKIICCE